MNHTEKRKDIDALIEQFWKRGYLTVSRKYGTYLPEPDKVGNYEVDVVARYNNSYAIGIILSDEDFFDLNKTRNKLVYLASRQTKNNQKKVTLFAGVSLKNYNRAKLLIGQLPEEIRKNIRLIQIVDRNTGASSAKIRRKSFFFS